ncbi:hypothetical protein TNCV_287231 [Trichonephila clavipes]|nr:hypothetical protein TNCV_287231 [Trichonephila clavipes]
MGRSNFIPQHFLRCLPPRLPVKVCSSASDNSMYAIASEFFVIQSISSLRDLEIFLETGNADQRPGLGRRRATTFNGNRHLMLTSSKTPSLGYWHHSFHTKYPTPAPSKGSLCLTTNVMCYVNSKGTCHRSQYCVRARKSLICRWSMLASPLMGAPNSITRYRDEII